MKSDTFICQLPSDVQLMIEVEIRDYLYKEFPSIDQSELECRIADAMSGRVCDVEDAIPLEKIEAVL